MDFIGLTSHNIAFTLLNIYTPDDTGGGCGVYIHPRYIHISSFIRISVDKRVVTLLLQLVLFLFAFLFHLQSTTIKTIQQNQA